MDSHFNTSNHGDDYINQVDYKSPNCLIQSFDKDNSNNKNIADEEARSWTTDLKKRIVSSKSKTAVTVFDVAEYILKKLGTMSTMKLQKLVYYCQAWSLVWDEKVLFPEDIQAWANGPVVKDLFNFHRGMFQISSIPIGNPDVLDDTKKETIDAVLDFYGEKPSQWLIDLTHNEEPWKKARVGMDMAERGNRIIKLDDMAEYYSSIKPDQ